MKKLIAKIENDDGVILVIDNIIKINFGALDRGNVSDTTNWGVFSNKGEIEFIDTKGNFKSIISNYSNIKICIYYHSNTEKLLATFLVDDYDYADESKKVSLTLKDVLIDWQDRNLEKYLAFYQKTIGAIWTEHLPYDDMRVTTAAVSKMLNTLVATSYMSESTRWAGIDKLCQATMLRCFCDFDGKPLLSDETPKQLNNIVIRSKNILSIDNRTRKSKTKTNNTSIRVKKFTKHISEAIAPEISFEWYRVEGVSPEYQNYIIAPFSTYSPDSSVARLTQVYPDGSVALYGGQAIVDLNTPEHLFSYEETPDITVKGVIGDNLGDLQDLIASTNPNKGFVGYNPITRITYHESSKRMTVFLEDRNATDKYSPELNVLNLVGYSCITGGSITVLGNFFTEDGEEVIGSVGGVEIPSNELIQTDSTYDGKSLGQHILDTIQEKYGNGVECVEIEVTPSDYYDINGVPIIDTNGTKPLFEKYDIVTPYVTRNGREQPYSTNADGSAKAFKIVGIEYSYAGLVKQKLYLQEYVG